jgi:hypothetical protein
MLAGLDLLRRMGQIEVLDSGIDSYIKDGKLRRELYDSFFSKPGVIKLLSKFFVHRIFIVLGLIQSVRVNRDLVISIVRAWVEVSFRIHGKDRFVRSLILVCPFPFSIKRQLSFINVLRRNNYTWVLSGIPYGLNGLIRAADGGVSFLEWECRAYKKAGYNLIRRYPQLQSYFTEDDYIFVANELNRCLKENGITVVNTSHGVNQSNPSVMAHIIEYLTPRQKEVYSLFSPGSKLIIQRNHSLEFNVERGNDTYFDNGVIFMLSNYSEAKQFYEDRLQLEALKLLRSTYQERFFVKYHPNSKIRYEGYNEIKEVPTAKNLKFFTLSSTSYYTFRNYGEFYFVFDEFFDPRDIFGKEINLWSCM